MKFSRPCSFPRDSIAKFSMKMDKLKFSFHSTSTVRFGSKAGARNRAYSARAKQRSQKRGVLRGTTFANGSPLWMPRFPKEKSPVCLPRVSAPRTIAVELLYFCMLTARVSLKRRRYNGRGRPITVISRHKRVVSEKAPRGCPLRANNTLLLRRGNR